MSSLKTERNLQAFIARLSKEGGLLAYRCKPTFISKDGVTDSKFEENKVSLVLEQKPSNFPTQPLKDLSNQKPLCHSNPDVSEEKLSRTFTKSLNLKTNADMLQVQAENSSKKFKVPANQQNNFKARRKSSIGSCTYVHNRRSNIGTLKKDTTENQATSKVNQNRHHPKSSATSFSQKDPGPLSIIDKVMTRHSLISLSRTKITPILRSAKKQNLAPPSSRAKENPVFSAVNKTDSTEKDLSHLGLVNHSCRPVKALEEKTEDNSEDCRRALQFQECLEKSNEDATQPLPLINFTILEQNDDESGSVLVHGFKDDPAPASTTEGALGSPEVGRQLRKGETFLFEASSHRPIDSKRSSRIFGRIPVLIKSSPRVNSGVASKDAHLVNAAASHSNRGHDPPSRRGVKVSRVARSSRGTPKILLTPPSFSSTSHSTPETSLASVRSRSLGEVEEAALYKHKRSFKTSPSAPPNSPCARKIWLKSRPNNVDHNNLRGQAHEALKVCPCIGERTFQDASTNTLLSNPLFDIPLSDVEGRIESMFRHQETILNAYQTSFEDMKAAFLKKSEMLVKELEESLQPLESLRREILASVKISQPYEQEESQVHDEEEDLKFEKSCQKYKFLNTPLPLKNKNRLSRSFSYPLSPESFLSPASIRGESFHSVESVSISPFTNLVGDFNRNSILPVTPLSHANYLGIKSSFKEQLTTLFN